MTDNHVSRPKQESLFEQISNGQAEAFDHFYHNWYRTICFFAWRLTQNPATAERSAMDTIAKAWQRRRNLQDLDQLQHFMYDTASNDCTNSLSTDTVIARSHSMLIARAYDLIDELPDTDRRVLGLCLFERSTPEEIALMLNITIPSVAVKKFRAITLLRSYLEQGLREENIIMPDLIKGEDELAGDLRTFQSFDPYKQLAECRMNLRLYAETPKVIKWRFHWLKKMLQHNCRE